MRNLSSNLLLIVFLLSISFQFPRSAIANKPGDYEKFNEAISAGNYKQIEALIQTGADVNAKGEAGYTPLQQALRFPNKEIVAMLIKAGADVNAKTVFGDTPLSANPYFAKKEIVDMLIKAGADVNAKNTKGETILMLAAEYLNIEFLAILINAGADVNAKDEKGSTALNKVFSYFATDRFKDMPEIIAMLLKAGADVNAKDRYGRTPLLLTLNKEIISMLIKAGADVNVMSEDKNTPLTHVLRNYVNIFYKEKMENQRTQLEIALISQEYKEIVAMLIKAGANVNETGIYGITPLQHALSSSNNEIVEMLIRSGAKEIQLLIPGQWSWWFCNENGYTNKNCINKMQITFDNKSNKRYSSVTIMLTIKDSNGNSIYKKKHTVDIDVDPGETVACSEFYLSQNVSEYTNGFSDAEKVKIDVEVLSGK